VSHRASAGVAMKRTEASVVEKAFTVLPKPLELTFWFRYKLTEHTICLGCPENVDFDAVFRGFRKAENPSLSARIT
jgi:hypothetical protein